MGNVEFNILSLVNLRREMNQQLFSGLNTTQLFSATDCELSS